VIDPAEPRDKERQVTLVVQQLRRDVPGGIGTYTKELVRALVARGDEDPEWLTLYASRSRGRNDPLRRLGATLRTTPIPGPLLTRLWEVGTGPRVAGSGIVHAPSLAIPPTHLPLVVTIHDLAFRIVPEAFSAHGRHWHERALRRAARVADAFIVPSESVSNQLLEAGLEIASTRVHVITEGSDHLEAPDLVATRSLLERNGIHGRYILSVGTIEPRKNLARLISAYAKVRDRLVEPCTLVICGPTGWMAEVEPTKGVVSVGSVSGGVLAGLYAGAEVVAYIPLSEGFGLPAVEAMRQSAVVLSSAVPSAATGAFLVDPLDVNEIAEGLVVCTTDGALRARLQSEGREYSEKLTWARTAEEHLRVWNELGVR